MRARERRKQADHARAAARLSCRETKIAIVTALRYPIGHIGYPKIGDSKMGENGLAKLMVVLWQLLVLLKHESIQDGVCKTKA